MYKNIFEHFMLNILKIFNISAALIDLKDHELNTDRFLSEKHEKQNCKIINNQVFLKITH